MKIIKRSGKEMVFDGRKIVAAIERANTEVAERLSNVKLKITAGA